MKLVFEGIVHHTCPVGDRERLSFTAPQQRQLLQAIREEQSVEEAIVLNTCNRLEFYLHAKKDFDCSLFLACIIEKFRPDAAVLWPRYRTQLADIDAVRHLFTVAAGLDSQLIGENQILAQLKSAYSASLECDMSKFFFHKLLHTAFRVGKAVRTHTKINCGAVSVGLAAVELAKKKLNLADSAAILVGAGENAALVAHYLLKAGLSDLIVANRNLVAAEQIARSFETGRVIPLDSISENLSKVDLVIASAASSQPLITQNDIDGIMQNRRGKKPLLLIDIAVPRNIDPAAARCENVSLYNIDNLNEIINENKLNRDSHIPQAQALVDEYTARFARWLDSLDVRSVIAGLTKSVTQTAADEALKYAGDFPQIPPAELEKFARSFAKKFLHGPISLLKTAAGEQLSSQQLQAAESIKKIFLSETDGARIR